jgi:hypothetical protein
MSLAVVTLVGLLVLTSSVNAQIISGGSRINLIGSRGSYDPSVANYSGSLPLWLVYSAVDPSPTFATQIPITVTTRAAFSFDSGASWTDSGVAINKITDVVVAGSQPGTWINEVPTIIYDGAAPAEQKYKLWWHHYLRISGIGSGSGNFEDGWIGYKTAATPTDLGSAAEAKFLVGSSYDNINNVFGPTQPPVTGSPLIHADRLDPALNSCIVFTEPGAMVTAGGVYLSISCIESSTATRPVLLKCSSPCDPRGSVWVYAGTLIPEAVAATFGSPNGVSAPDIFAQGESYYLIVTKMTNNAYNGCLVFKFANLDTATLAPFASAIIGGDPTMPNGACTYRPEAFGSGAVYGQVDLSGAVPAFSIMTSKQRIN